MHVVEGRQRQEGFPREELQPAAGIGGTVTQDSPTHAVGDPRRDALGKSVVPRPPVPVDEKRFSRALRVPRAEERRDVRGIVLAVAVERHDPGRPREANARPDRGALSGRRAVTRRSEARKSAACLAKADGRRVFASVVHDDDLVLDAPLEGRLDVGEKRTDVVGFVASWDDDGDLGDRWERPAGRRRRARLFLFRPLASEHGPFNLKSRE